VFYELALKRGLMTVSKKRECFLDKQDMEERRSPEELEKWVQSVLAKAGTIPYKESLRLKIGLFKEFLEEIFPINFLLQSLFDGRDDVTYQPQIGNQPYDGILEIHGCDKRYVEITFPHDGETDKLHMEYLNEHGGLHTSGGIGRNKKTRKLETTPGARFVTDIKKDIFKLIKNGLEAKYNKRYDKVYMLVLFFEDLQVFKNDNDQQELRDFVKNDLLPLSSTFEVVYLVGASHGTIMPVKPLAP